MILAKPGREYCKVDQTEFCLDVANPRDYQALFKRLDAEGRFPARIVYVGQESPQADDAASSSSHFFSLLHLTQVLAEQSGERTAEIVVCDLRSAPSCRRA